MQAGIQDAFAFHRRFVLVLVAAVTIVFCFMIKGFFEALVMAAVFGALIRPFYFRILSALKNRESLASALTLLITLIVIILPSIIFIGVLASQAEEVSTILSPWIDRQIESAGSSTQVLPDWIPFREQLTPYGESISAKLAELVSATGQWLAANLSAAAKGTATFFINLFVMLYAMYFYLISGPELVRQAMGFLPLAPDDRVRILEVARSVSMATVKGTVIIGAIQGILGGLSLAIAGIPGAAFWGALMAVMSIIPGVGPSVVWGPIVVYLAFKGDHVTAGVLFAWNAGVVGTIDNILRPRLVGQDTKMPDLLILLSTLGGLTLFGASGIIIGPVIAGLFLTVWSIYGSVFKDALLLPDEE